MVVLIAIVRAYLDKYGLWKAPRKGLKQHWAGKIWLPSAQASRSMERGAEQARERRNSMDPH